MSTQFEKLPDSVNQQASEWFTLLQSDKASQSDRQRFESWLSQSPEHALAWQQMQQLWQQLGELALTEQGRQLKHSVSRPPSAVSQGGLRGFIENAMHIGSSFKRYGINVMAMVMLAVVVIWTVIPPDTENVAEEQYFTNIGEIRPLTLADGSKVILGAKSAISVKLGQNKRTVVLLKGDAFFEVTKNVQRPFTVAVDDVSVTVVGTRFDVRKRADSVSVAVTEGIVAVEHVADTTTSSATAQALRLTAGQRVTKPSGHRFLPVTPVSNIELAAWRNGRLIYANARLGDVISDANRYLHNDIVLKTAELADLKVTVTLKTSQIDVLPDMLSQSLPVVVRRLPGHQIVLERAVATDRPL